MPYVDIVELVSPGRSRCGMLGWGKGVAGLGLKALFGLSDFIFDIAERFVKASGVPHVLLEGLEVCGDRLTCVFVSFSRTYIIEIPVSRFVDQVIDPR